MVNIKNTVVKNSIFSVLQIIFSTLCYVVIYYLILNKLGKKELGIWSIITSLPIAISVFGSGVSGCVLRYIPVYSVQKDKKAFNEIIFNGLIFNILFGIVIVFLGYFFSLNILCFLFSDKEVPIKYVSLFHISLVTFFFSFITSVLLFAIDGLQLIFLRNKIVVFNSILFCILASIFINFWDLKGILLAQLFQSMLLFLFAVFVVLKVELFDFSLFKFNKSYFKLFFTYGQGFQVISITILLFEPITKFFLNKYFNLSTVGIYDLVSRAVTQIRVLIVSAVQVIIPLVSKNNEQRQLNIDDVYKKTIRGASLLSFILFSTFLCFGMIVINFLDKVNINQYLCISILLCVSYHFNILASAAYSILMGLGKLKYIIISHILLSLLNILFFIFFGQNINNDIVVLPTSLAIIISSAYLLYVFKKDFNILKSKTIINDYYIRITSLITITLTLFFVLYRINIIVMFILFVFQSLLLTILIIKNDFFKNFFNK